MKNTNLETLKENLENTLRYWYEIIKGELFVESLDTRLESLEEMKALILAIKTIISEKFNPKNLNTIIIKTEAKLDIVLEYNKNEDVYELAFRR
ncbi:hypothetical protein OLP40_03190 [Campylobacter jejuni]|nr:hypothetical protein C414_000090000 [Campylobacter jejuni subsp. jejuni 414]MCW1333351.1 hypothetical protein [Campylobacter jejuni]MCW1359154.1 hypothetical protein [Campylobacter jejuni]HDZ4933057.1 hypothetical protein [Campylobacter jejuni]HDZ4937533.1 hypothetical protein [Campylobacter jejuni]